MGLKRGPAGGGGPAVKSARAGAGAAGAGAGLTRAEAAAALGAVYAVHAPERMPKIAGLLERWSGREDEIVCKVRHKYLSGPCCDGGSS
eukprot:COSAG01_NODE_41796_length_447_cov_0.847701_1_plen_88_part_10